jgi:hypothetical protein
MHAAHLVMTERQLSAELWPIKLLLSPALIGIASWISGRFGPDVGGWFAALPLTSGPVVLVLALERGPAFAADSSVGIVLALVSLAAFSVAYAWVSRRSTWGTSVGCACAVYAVCTLLLRDVPASLGVAVILACIALAISLRVMPSVSPVRPSVRRPRWDIPVRMALAAALVSVLAASAASTGPRLSGLLTPFPIAATVLTAFTHRFDGSAASTRLLRGLLTGLYSFAAFFLVVGTLIMRHGVMASFAAGTAAALSTHAVAWAVMRAHLTLESPRRAT